MFKPLICAFALAATASAASAASLEIKTSDLDLTTEAGVKALDKRIMAAARKVCDAQEPNTGSRIATKAGTACVKRTATEARERVAALNPRSNS